MKTVMENRKAILQLNEQNKQIKNAIDHLSKVTMDMVVFMNAILKKGIVTNDELQQEQEKFQASILKASPQPVEGSNIQSQYPRADASDCKRS